MRTSTDPDRRRSFAVPVPLRAMTAFALALIFILPLAWAVSISLHPAGLPPPRTVELLQRPAAWSNYVAIFRLVPLMRYLLNSLIIVGLAVPLTLVTASWAGMAMAL